MQDATFQERFHSIPAHWDVKVIRKGAFPKGTGGYLINVSGPNARVNLHSTDNSTNIAVAGSVYGDLRTAILGGVENAVERTALVEALARLEGAPDQASKLETYQKFIAAGANHMTILAPFLAPLTALIFGQPAG